MFLYLRRFRFSGSGLGSKHVNLTSMDQERAPTLGVNLQGRLPFTDGRGAYPVLKAIHPGLVRKGAYPELMDNPVLKATNSRVLREHLFVFELKRLLSFVLVGPG